MIKRETLISGVPAFLRLDAVDILSREDDKDLVFDPLETTDDRAVEEENFEIIFLDELLNVLSMDVEGTLEDEESDEEDLTLDVIRECPLLASELLPTVLGVLVVGEEGTEFLVSMELERTEALPANEGSELLRGSGRDRLNGSVVVEEPVFLPTAELTLLICFSTGTCCCFSGKLPVLFLLTAEPAFDVVLPLSIVGFLRVDLTTLGTLLGSIFFRVVPVVEPETFKDDETVGFITLLVVVFTLSAEDCVFVSEIGTLSNDPSSPSISPVNQQTLHHKRTNKSVTCWSRKHNTL